MPLPNTLVERPIMILFLCLFTVVMSSLSLAQAQAADAALVPLPLRAEPNSIAEIQYSHLKNKNGKSNEGIIHATLHIKEFIDEGFIAQWTTNSVSVGDMIIDKGHPQAGSFFIGIPFKYIADADGTPLKIHNRKELLSSLEKSDVFAEMDQKAVRKTIDFFASLPEEALVQIFIKVPSFMALCQGTNLKLGENTADQVVSPSPFGEGTIISDVSYILHSIDRSKKHAEIEYNLKFNPDSLRKAITQFADKLVSKEEFDTEQLEGISISRKDSANCVLDTETGWVKSMSYSKSITAPQDSQVEKFDISVKWN